MSAPPPTGRARLFIAGPVIAATTADAAAADVEKIAAMGVDWLKFRVDDNLGATKKMPKEAWKTVIERGHAKNLPVAAHGKDGGAVELFHRIPVAKRKGWAGSARIKQAAAGGRETRRSRPPSSCIR